MGELKQLVRVFVYGTLKPGEANYQRYCANILEAKRAIAFGQLFTLPMGYPAMTLGNSPVNGYLLTLSNKFVLQNLDDLEDYNPHRAIAQNLYNRQQIETYDPDLTSLGLAWVYLMTPKQVCAYGGVLVPNGWWSGCGLSLPDYPK